MNKNIIKIAGLALATAFALPARADVAIHQNASLYGYAAGSAQYVKPNKGASDMTMDLDAAKLGLAFNFAPITARVSLYTDTDADDLYILEANVTYDIGNGLSITGGRFQSWIGYEAFDIPNGNFITNGMALAPISGAGIPNFHEGLRVDCNIDKMSFGVAVVDSVYTADTFSMLGIFSRQAASSPGELEEIGEFLDLIGYSPAKYRGNGKLSDGYGVEAHFGYNDGAFSLGATLAYQNNRANGDINSIDSVEEILALTPKSDVYVGDVWAQYIIKNTTIGAELFYSHTNLDFDGASLKSDVFYGLAMVKQQFSEKLSFAGRFTAGQEKFKIPGEYDIKAAFWKLSAQPAYAVTQNLSIGVEVSYTKYDKDAKLIYGKGDLFAGIQAVFKF